MPSKASFQPFLVPALILLFVGWGGLALLLNTTRPELWPRWGFFALTVMAVTGTALPFSYLLNQRLLAKDAGVTARQAIWVGIYAAVLAWLEIGRALSFSVALWLLLGFLGVEYLAQLRDGAGKPRIARARSGS